MDRYEKSDRAAWKRHGALSFVGSRSIAGRSCQAFRKSLAPASQSMGPDEGEGLRAGGFRRIPFSTRLHGICARHDLSTPPSRGARPVQADFRTVDRENAAA